jgi:hypothetical protein
MFPLRNHLSSSHNSLGSKLCPNGADKATTQASDRVDPCAPSVHFQCAVHTKLLMLMLVLRVACCCEPSHLHKSSVIALTQWAARQGPARGIYGVFKLIKAIRGVDILCFHLTTWVVAGGPLFPKSTLPRQISLRVSLVRPRASACDERYCSSFKWTT